jgi:histidyl-tRNA synthetase
MIEQLGGPKVPAIGFAAGLERLLIASALPEEGPAVEVFVAPLGGSAGPYALALGKDLRKAGVTCEVDARGASLKALLRRASGMGARLAVIVGDDEIAQGAVQVKDMGAQQQEKVARDRVVSHVTDKLGLRGASS